MTALGIYYETLRNKYNKFKKNKINLLKNDFVDKINEDKINQDKINKDNRIVKNNKDELEHKSNKILKTTQISLINK